MTAGETGQNNKKLILLALVTTIAALLLGTFFVIPIFAVRNPKSTLIDKFNSKLNPGWTVADPDGGSTFDLSANKGWLRITSPSGRDLLPVKFDAPFITVNSHFSFSKTML